MIPDPGDPMIVVPSFLLGGFAGGALGRIGCPTRDGIRRRTEDGAFYLTALGIVVCLLTLAMRRL